MLKFALGVLLIGVLPLHAQTKQPWALTLEERIALRTNPDLAEERVRRTTRVAANSETSRSADDFNGQTHPELFLPTEVFRSLIQLAYLGSPRSGQLLRKGLMPEVKRLDLPPDFWERLRSVSTIYMADSFAEQDLGASLQKESAGRCKRVQDALVLKQRDVCRSRANALADARREFGQERFDRFLYEVIAVNKFHSADSIPDPELLRRIEQGCP